MALEEERAAYLALALTPGIGAQRLASLLAACQTAPRPEAEAPAVADAGAINAIDVASVESTTILSAEQVAKSEVDATRARRLAPAFAQPQAPPPPAPMLNAMSPAMAMAVLASEMCEHIAIYATAGSDPDRKHATRKVAPFSVMSSMPAAPSANTIRRPPESPLPT